MKKISGKKLQLRKNVVASLGKDAQQRVVGGKPLTVPDCGGVNAETGMTNCTNLSFKCIDITTAALSFKFC